jgi:hypothetical protein
MPNGAFNDIFDKSPYLEDALEKVLLDKEVLGKSKRMPLKNDVKEFLEKYLRFEVQNESEHRVLMGYYFKLGEFPPSPKYIKDVEYREENGEIVKIVHIGRYIDFLMAQEGWKLLAEGSAYITVFFLTAGLTVQGVSTFTGTLVQNLTKFAAWSAGKKIFATVVTTIIDTVIVEAVYRKLKKEDFTSEIFEKLLTSAVFSYLGAAAATSGKSEGFQFLVKDIAKECYEMVLKALKSSK